MNGSEKRRRDVADLQRNWVNNVFSGWNKNQFVSCPVAPVSAPSQYLNPLAVTHNRRHTTSRNNSSLDRSEGRTAAGVTWQLVESVSLGDETPVGTTARWEYRT
jgi:hypothetical protein